MKIDFDAENICWDISWADVLLRLRLLNGAVLTEYFGPAADGNVAANNDLFFDPLLNTRADAVVLLAPYDTRVLWQLREWAQADDWRLELILAATDQPLQAFLTFDVDPITGILRRKTLLTHSGAGDAVDISSAGSLAAVLPGVQEVVYLTGRWGAENQIQRTTLPTGQLLLESKAGKTGFPFAPYVALLAGQNIYVSALLWSGNWQYVVRRLLDGSVALTAGLNAWGLRHTLRPGDELSLPDAVLGCVAGDLNVATQQLHDYRRRKVQPEQGKKIPVHFNSWFPYQGEPPVAKMKEFALAAAELGCEVFVQDAGWYTTAIENPDEGWWPRTGDWIVNKRLFPNGLEELADYCRANGVGFGIWMEPEAIGPSAWIHRERPEWLHAVGGRPVGLDERGILHLGVPEAREFMRDKVLGILRSTEAVWLKWDFNTDIYQGGWAKELPEELTRQDPIIAHVKGLYQTLDEIRAALPDLVLEVCSSGGGRFDGGILGHAHANWISDQTHPLMKLAIHFGSQLAHPPEECNDWLVEWPPHEAQEDALRAPNSELPDLAFRTRVAMLGSFGVSAPVGQWSEEDKALVRRHVDLYKNVVSSVIGQGRQYLLTAAPALDGSGEWAAIWYVLPDASRGVLFAFRLAGGQPERAFDLPGLDPNTGYKITSPEGFSLKRSGADLLQRFTVTTDAPFRSVLLVVEKE